jgi:hypothetical protein
MPQVASSSVAGKVLRMSSSTGLEVSTDGAEIARQRLAQVDAELLVQRLVQPSSSRTRCDHVFGRTVAHNRQHRIDRHDAADEEGDGEQPR